MRNPETSRRLICVEETVRSTGINDQVVNDQILCLNCIFNEDGVAHCLVGNVT